jgi:hypothetical protein
MIERNPDDLVKPWPFLDQLLLALATLAFMGLLFMAIGHLA